MFTQIFWIRPAVKFRLKKVNQRIVCNGGCVQFLLFFSLIFYFLSWCRLIGGLMQFFFRNMHYRCKHSHTRIHTRSYEHMHTTLPLWAPRERLSSQILEIDEVTTDALQSTSMSPTTGMTLVKSWNISKQMWTPVRGLKPWWVGSTTRNLTSPGGLMHWHVILKRLNT
jgi:hypothetical protein